MENIPPPPTLSPKELADLIKKRSTEKKVVDEFWANSRTKAQEGLRQGRMAQFEADKKKGLVI